jgi:hypothetical protein
MHRSHIPIQEWFWAAYLVATHTPGISAVQIQRQLGSSSDTTAWHMLHRLRKGMVNENRRRLSGLIEADESIIGGPAKGKRGRGVTAAQHKTLVIGAVEVLTYEDKKGTRCERAGRLRLSTLDDAGEVSIRHFLTQNIETGSTLRTDGWRGYSNDALVSYQHRARVVRTPERAHRVAPHIHRVFSNLKTWINGPIMASIRSICKVIWMSLFSDSTDATRRWPPSRPYWGFPPGKRCSPYEIWSC